MRFVSATKGLEQDTLLRVSEVIQAVVRPKFEPRVAVLSGPTFAKEIARGEPAAVVISSEDRALAAEIQREFHGPSFRLYTNSDPIGVEIGAALKNVIAIAAGVCQGMGLGNNASAALITRGLAEITRLAVAMGGQPKTLAGLAGLGDLVLTCTGGLSRNRTVGHRTGSRALDRGDCTIHDYGGGGGGYHVGGGGAGPPVFRRSTNRGADEPDSQPGSGPARRASGTDGPFSKRGIGSGNASFRPLFAPGATFRERRC